MENGCRQSFAQRNEKALVWDCVTICVTSTWVLQVSGASIWWWRMMGYPALAWKNHSFQARESAMWKQLNIALFKPWSFSVFLSFSLNLPFRRHRWLPFNSSFHQRIFQARSSCKEPRIMSSNRRVSMPVNAVRRSPRRRTKTPSVNELSRKCSK